MRNVIARLMFTAALLFTGAGATLAQAADRFFTDVGRAELSDHIHSEIAAGLELKSLHGYVDSGRVHFATVWGQPSGAPRWLFWDVDLPTLVADVEGKRTEGYHVMREEGFTTPDGPRFNVIMEKGGDQTWLGWVNFTPEGFQRKFNEMGAQGFRLVDMSVYSDGGQTWYGGVWRKDGGAQWAYWDVAPQDGQAAFDRATGQGFVASAALAYDTPQGVRFAVLYDKPNPSPAWVTRGGLTMAALQSSAYELGGQGFSLVDLAVYHENGELRAQALWRKQPDPSPPPPPPVQVAEAPPPAPPSPAPPPPDRPPVSTDCKVNLAKQAFNVGIGFMALLAHKDAPHVDVDENACDGQ